MSRSASLPCVALVALASVLSTAGCGGDDDTQKRLSDVLGKEGIKEITVTDAKVTATCARGGKVDVDASELERNFLGMVKSERVSVVANKLYKSCDDSDRKQQNEEAAKAELGTTAKSLGIDIASMDETAAKKAICEKLTQQLPLKDPDRAVQDARNQAKWGCAPAPPVAELPTGAWQVEQTAAKGKRPGPAYARLADEAGSRLTIACRNRKYDVYLQVPESVKKRTKIVMVKPAGGRPMKWKARPSTDGKAIFFTDTRGTLRGLEAADAVTFSIPLAKKSMDIELKTKGLGETLKQMPKGCH